MFAVRFLFLILIYLAHPLLYHLERIISLLDFILQVDDPIASVRKLFMSPTTKKMKITRESS